MKYKNMDIAFASENMKFEVIPSVSGVSYPRKYYVSVAAAKKAIDSAQEKKVQLAKAQKAKPVKVFTADVGWESEVLTTKQHTVKKFEMDGVGKHRRGYFVTDTKSNSWSSGTVRISTPYDENDGVIEAFDIKDLEKVKELGARRTVIAKQIKKLEADKQSLEDRQDDLRLTKSSLLALMGLPTDL